MSFREEQVLITAFAHKTQGGLVVQCRVSDWEALDQARNLILAGFQCVSLAYAIADKIQHVWRYDAFRNSGR